MIGPYLPRRPVRGKLARRRIVADSETVLLETVQSLTTLKECIEELGRSLAATFSRGEVVGEQAVDPREIELRAVAAVRTAVARGSLDLCSGDCGPSSGRARGRR